MTTKLPILLSVPHAGLHVPAEAEPFCVLTNEQIIKDGDEGASEIYALQDYVMEYVTTDIARAIVDLNRSVDDRRADGVVKTLTCWNEPVYKEPLSDVTIEQLLDRYYRPFHEHLDRIDDAAIRLCVDCHTMAGFGPPIGPDVGQPRPFVCLGDANGETLPEDWMNSLSNCFRESFGACVTINNPFSGGYITRRHGQNRPWVQIELSRVNFLSNLEKRKRVLDSLASFCDWLPK